MARRESRLRPVADVQNQVRHAATPPAVGVAAAGEAEVGDQGRLRSDRVMRKPVAVPWISPPQGGRPPKHGKEFRFAKPDTWGEPDAATRQVTDRYGTAQTMAWDRIHPRLTTRSAWICHDGELLGFAGLCQ